VDHPDELEYAQTVVAIVIAIGIRRIAQNVFMSHAAVIDI
jgi:hypothetical protein